MPESTKLIVIFIASLLLAYTSSYAQEGLPNKIRGYSLHRSDISVVLLTHGELRPAENRGVLVTIDKPTFSGIGLTGATISVTGSVEAFDQDGDIDFVMFRDFTVNGVPVQIAEYTDKLRLRKGQPFRISRPVMIKANPLALARALASNGARSGDKWRVSGTALIFGRFKKFGFSFKRVIPVKVSVMIADPFQD